MRGVVMHAPGKTVAVVGDGAVGLFVFSRPGSSVRTGSS
jgi:hypothetical protein